MKATRDATLTPPAARPDGPAATVPAVLARARALTEPALRNAIGRLSPDVRRVVGYHFGFLDSDGRPARGAGGKAVRPALTILAAEACGGGAADAVPGAVAVEFVHNFSLLHDDVMDDDAERRHRPTAWAVFGVGPAVLAGDALLILAQQVLLDPPDPGRVQAAAVVAEATSRLIAGQGSDLAFESRTDVSVEECLEMCAGKTGALLRCATAVGAILAGAPPATVEGLGAFGAHLGLAFQAVDDLLGIWGRPEDTGKPAWSDLRQGKKSLPVVAALGAGGGGAEQLARLLAEGDLGDGDLAAAARLVENLGGRDWTAQRAERHLRLALECLERLALDEVAAAQLTDLARFVTRRTF